MSNAEIASFISLNKSDKCLVYVENPVWRTCTVRLQFSPPKPCRWVCFKKKDFKCDYLRSFNCQMSQKIESTFCRRYQTKCRFWQTIWSQHSALCHAHDIKCPSGTLITIRFVRHCYCPSCWIFVVPFSIVLVEVSSSPRFHYTSISPLPLDSSMHL